MHNLKKKISKRKPTSRKILENDLPLNLNAFNFSEQKFISNEEAKILDEDLIIIPKEDFSIYLKELDFSKTDLKFSLPKPFQNLMPHKFVAKEFIQSIFEEIQENSNFSQISDILSFLRKLIAIDEELEKEEIAKGLVKIGVFLIFDSFFNKNLIYFSKNSLNAKHQNKHAAFKLMELSIEIITVIFGIINEAEISIESPLSETLLIYLENSEESEIQIISLNFFDGFTKKIKKNSSFFAAKNLQRFFGAISQKMVKNNLEINITATRIIRNIFLKNSENESFQETFDFFFKQGDFFLETIFSVVGIKIFEELSFLMNSFDAQNLKKARQKLLKDFSINHHLKEGLQIWLSSENSLEKALDLLIEVFKSNDFEEIEYFEENNEESMEIENEEEIQKIDEESLKFDEKEGFLSKIELINRQNLLNYGLEKLLLDKLKLPLRSQIEFLTFFESKLGDLFRKIKKVIFLTINCFTEIYSSPELKFQENLLTLSNFLLNNLNEALILDKELPKHPETPAELDIKDLIMSYLRLLCVLIENNREICEKIPYFDIISLHNKLRNNDEEAYLIFIDIAAKRFLPKNSNLKENEEVCGMLKGALEQKNGVMAKGQILNCIFDVFQDEQFDENFVKFGIWEKIKNSTFDAKKLRKHGKIKNKSDYSFLSEVSLNLRNFIIYKEKMLNFNF